MSEEANLYSVDDIIVTVRGQKVILDTDLATLYGVTTKALNQAVKRNPERFPPEFAFVLTQEEVRDMRSQFVTASNKRNIRHIPFAFTEHGAMMAATILRSPKAVEMSVFIVKAFVRMRQALGSRADMEKRLDQIEKILLVHDDGLRDLYEKIRPLLLPPPDTEKPRIGFSVRERRAIYRAQCRSK